MTKAFIGLGSNLGDRLGFMSKALAAMAEAKDVRVAGVSGVYETEPYGFTDQPHFLNAVATIDVGMPPRDLLALLKRIEEQLGRTRHEKWGPREIDLDILYFGDLVIDDEAFSIPHPGIAGRRFVLVPMSELAPEFVDPKRGMAVSELLRMCQDDSRVVKTNHAMNYPQQVA